MHHRREQFDKGNEKNRKRVPTSSNLELCDLAENGSHAALAFYTKRERERKNAGSEYANKEDCLRKCGGAPEISCQGPRAPCHAECQNEVNKEWRSTSLHRDV